MLEFVSSNQGSENTGKVLVTNTTGEVSLAEPDDTITVYSGMRHGKNFINPDDPDWSETSFINASGQRVATKGENPSSSYTDNFGHTGLCPVKEGYTYTYSSDCTGDGNIRIHAYDASGNWLQQIWYTSGASWTGSKSFTTPAGCKFVLCNFFKENRTFIQLEEGNTATEYEPYYEENVQTIGANIDMEAVTETIEEKVEEVVSEMDLTPVGKMHNPPLRMDKGTFRVLDIGNSFTQDCISYLPSLITHLGVDASNMSFTSAYRGGASYKNWFDIFHDNDTSSYTIEKKFGGLTETYPGSHGIGQGECFRNCLKDHHYDLIIIHQVSTYSGAYQGWEGTGADGYLKEFIRLLRFYQPQAHIGFLMVHASPRQQQSGEANTRPQWQRIVDSAKWLVQNYDIDFIVPAATAVENLRISTDAQNAAHQLTRDNHHMAYGLCRYTGNCTYYETVFAPYFGKSMYNSGWMPTTETAPSGYESDCISLTNVNVQVGQMCAMLAINDKWTLTNPDGLYIGPEEDVPVPPTPVDPTEGMVQLNLTAPDNMEQGWWAWSNSATPTVSDTTAGVLLDDGAVNGNCASNQGGNTDLINNNGPTQVFFRPTESTLVPVGSKIKLPTGYSARCNWYGENYGWWRSANTLTGDGATYVELEPISLDSVPSDHQFTRVYLSIYRVADQGSGTGQGRSILNDTYINARIADGIEIWVPEGPYPEYEEMILDTTNVLPGWWRCASGSAGTTANTIMNISSGYPILVADHSTTPYIGLPEVDMGSKLVIPAGYSMRPQYINSTTRKAIRDGAEVEGPVTFNTATDYNCPAATMETLNPDKVRMHYYKVADVGQGGASVDTAYIEANLPGFVMYVPENE